MGTYELSGLVARTRRDAGDMLRRQEETIVASGSRRVPLGAQYHVVLVDVEVDDAPPPSGMTVTLSGTTLVFDPVLEEGSEVLVTYDAARFTDPEVIEFLADASRTVASDIVGPWSTDSEEATITDLTNTYVRADDTIVDTLAKLLSLKAAIQIVSSKANSAADDAILIRDGDTTIDTSKGAGAIDKRLTALSRDYGDAWRRALANRFTGHAT